MALGGCGGVSVATGVAVGVAVAVEVGVAVKVAMRVLVGVGEAAGALAISEPSEHPSVTKVKTGISKMIGATLSFMI